MKPRELSQIYYKPAISQLHWDDRSQNTDNLKFYWKMTNPV